MRALSGRGRSVGRPRGLLLLLLRLRVVVDAVSCCIEYRRGQLSLGQDRPPSRCISRPRSRLTRHGHGSNDGRVLLLRCNIELLLCSILRLCTVRRWRTRERTLERGHLCEPKRRGGEGREREGRSSARERERPRRGLLLLLDYISVRYTRLQLYSTTPQIFLHSLVSFNRQPSSRTAAIKLSPPL